MAIPHLLFFTLRPLRRRVSSSWCRSVGTVDTIPLEISGHVQSRAPLANILHDRTNDQSPTFANWLFIVACRSWWHQMEKCMDGIQTGSRVLPPFPNLLLTCTLSKENKNNVTPQLEMELRRSKMNFWWFSSFFLLTNLKNTKTHFITSTRTLFCNCIPWHY